MVSDFVTSNAPTSRHRSHRPGLFASVALLALWLCLPLSASALPAENAEPTEVVHALESALIESMKVGKSLSLVERRDRLTPVVERALDLPRMARFIFGGAWRDMSEDERQGFLTVFSELSATTYANRFDKHKGERFDPVSEAGQGRDRMLVRSRFTKSNRETVSFDYLLMNSEGRWAIVNIMVDGISDLALKRSQYGGLYGKGGMEAVVENIRNQIERMHGE